MNTNYIEKIRDEYIEKYYSIPIIQKYIEITDIDNMEIAGYLMLTNYIKRNIIFILTPK